MALRLATSKCAVRAKTIACLIRVRNHALLADKLYSARET
jgi:hypothetical protein